MAWREARWVGSISSVHWSKWLDKSIWAQGVEAERLNTIGIAYFQYTMYFTSFWMDFSWLKLYTLVCVNFTMGRSMAEYGHVCNSVMSRLRKSCEPISSIVATRTVEICACGHMLECIVAC